MDKNQAIDALAKRLPEISDNEIACLIGIPDSFWPTNPHNHTPEGLIAEQIRRKHVSDVHDSEIIEDAVYLTLLRHLLSFGPNVFREMDLIGREAVKDEIQKLQKEFDVKHKRWSEQ